MNSVVAGRVIPSAVQVDEARTVGQAQMPVRLIDEPARPLAFEVEEDIRKRLALEKIVFNFLANALKYTPRGKTIELFVKAPEAPGAALGGCARGDKVARRRRRPSSPRVPRRA